ncbi:MAG TPA: sigma 54-interacting transcriptional regulator [Polyangiaceae bacterium]|nr:sigma 54-interacting transcriptional regulator [Polyangiaceae bacterium]
MKTFETQTDGGSGIPASVRPEHWVLTVAHHREGIDALGERLVLLDNESVVLGRGCKEFGGEVFDDPRVSRQHVRVRCQNGILFAEDLQSRNGTLLNGRTIDRAELAEGDVLTVGGVLLLAHRGPRVVPRHRDPEIVGVGPACARVLHRIGLAARADVVVLIRGETGVGKELVARAIHAQSGRKGRFVAVNCSALSDGVLHSELFGHKKGAFSGATNEREGLVAAADGGTLLLDEIGDASPALQGALLRLLEQREYREVGSTDARTTTARFVMATNVPLEEAVEDGSFRTDLFGRINRWIIDVPPLRERQEDVMPLAHHFGERYAKHPVRFARSFAQALLRYDWPANVRELQGIVERAVLEQPESAVLSLTEELARRLQSAPAASSPAAPMVRRGVRRVRPSAEDLYARFQALGCNASALAAELGVGRTTVYRWFREAGLEVGDIRGD